MTKVEAMKSNTGLKSETVESNATNSPLAKARKLLAISTAKEKGKQIFNIGIVV